jgi:phosphoribosyl 1,2-cyclic phosphodiesterase
VSLHLTPASLAGELAKLKRKTQVYLYHFKPPYLDELRAEIAATDLSHPVVELDQDRTYDF